LIGSVKGRIEEKGYNCVIVDVNGVGYEIVVSATTLASLPEKGSPIRLYTFTYLREDILRLYGFIRKEERELFEKLISISGIGPKVAMAILSFFSVDEFRRAVMARDVEFISTVPGIGKKTASRLILEMKEKIGLPELEFAAEVGISEEERNAYADARAALLELGYTSRDVDSIFRSYRKEGPERPSVEDIVKFALRHKM
jgi:Holliday junction DNA helicase RuvA